MRHGSLFSGIGGFDLAASWMEWENVFHCEWNEFGTKILKHYWPEAISYDDITKTDFTIHNGKIDILTGGFPCQPYSQAGKRRGTEDERHLWPEMLRAIREIGPRWIVGENVLGIVNWNDGLVFEEVQTDLEVEGYKVQAFVLPAAAVGAPHQRYRVWFVAHSKSDGRNSPGHQQGENAEIRIRDLHKCSGEGRDEIRPKPERHREGRNASNSGNQGLQRSEKQGGAEKSRQERDEQFAGCVRPGWQEFPTQSPVRGRNDGLSRQLVRYLTKEVYDEISKTSEENRIENMPEVWQKIQQKEVWEKIRGLYSLDSKEVLLQTMQLYSGRTNPPDNISPFSERVSEIFLRKLRKHGEFGCSPQGQRLQKQRSKEFENTLSFLPHEIPLAAGAFETAITKFDAWHRNESIKGYGNAIVPQVALQIFKTIHKYEHEY